MLGSGHLWQGRFKAFPIQEDGHLLAVLRYVERNPLRAGLVERSEDWPWSSARLRHDGDNRLPPPLVELPPDWLAWVNQSQTEAELQALRTCVNRNAPLGDAAWTKKAAARLGLESTLRPRGRPRKPAPAPTEGRRKR